MLITAYYKDKKISIYDYENHMKDNITCPLGHKLIAKRGNIKAHHFAHKSNHNCLCNRDMSEWHCNWQRYLNVNNIEVIMKKDNKRHIADCVNEDGIVIEFQKSIISEDIIHERERFYKNMIWIFDVSLIDLDIRKKDDKHCDIYIISGSKFFLNANKRSYLDTGKRGIIRIKDVQGTKISGRIIEYKRFIKRYFNNINTIRYFRDDAPLI